MADKRISQLIERVDIANNDVLPIVASGATTTNKVTVSTLQDWMQDNLDVGVTSVGLTMPSAFQVSGSPITTSGNITVTATGTASQYIRGDGTLADFPQGGGGGGASVSYYLNGSVSQGTIGGVTYLEMNKTPVLGAGTDFNISADGYIASFITDAGDPALLEIPAGNWNFETYFQASSGGGTPSFYIELYKVSGSTATLIASNSANPELIAFGTNTTPYFSALAVPQTTLALTDRLAIRIYVVVSGRTITLHTENSNLCQIITTFTTGLTALNGLTAQVQNFATGTSGTDFNISSSGSVHTFNLPDASASNRGAVTTGTQTFAGYKIFNGTIGVNNDIQLATQGTALNTFIKNINSTGLTSIGSNGFGFNNANNIYFSGSNKGGGVFAFSNTGTQIYTLPDASGTISLTSDLGAYLPLSGGTMTGAINGISANFTSNLSSDSGVYSNTAFFAKHNPGSTVTVNGWNAMQGDANTFIVLNSTKGMRINFPSNASFTHTLPDASGTIALTSNLSSYLPLAGGTLTGALNGTSATFLSGSSSTIGLVVGGAGGSGATRQGQIRFGDAGTVYKIQGGEDYSAINFMIGSGTPLSLSSTGAATFSSNVGVGVTPHSWDAGWLGGNTNNLEVGQSGSSISAGVGGMLVMNNVVVNGGAAKYARSFPATYYIQNTSSGQHQWFTAPSGTAGNAITFTQSMTLTNTGNVGIGTTSPSGKLTISSDQSLNNQFLNIVGTQSGFSQQYTIQIPASSKDLRFYDLTADTERMRITSGGNVLVGTSSSSGDKFEVNGSIASSGSSAALVFQNQASTNKFVWYGNTNIILYNNAVGNIASINESTGVYTALSDINKKKDFEESTIGLNEVMALKPTLYRMESDESEGQKELGFIAQEVKEVIPHAYVESGEDENKFIGLNYNPIVAALVKSVQEQQEQIKSLTEQVEALKSQING